MGEAWAVCGGHGAHGPCEHTEHPRRENLSMVLFEREIVQEDCESPAFRRDCDVEIDNEFDGGAVLDFVAAEDWVGWIFRQVPVDGFPAGPVGGLPGAEEVFALFVPDARVEGDVVVVAEHFEGPGGYWLFDVVEFDGEEFEYIGTCLVAFWEYCVNFGGGFSGSGLFRGER